MRRRRQKTNPKRILAVGIAIVGAYVIYRYWNYLLVLLLFYFGFRNWKKQQEKQMCMTHKEQIQKNNLAQMINTVNRILALEKRHLTAEQRREKRELTQRYYELLEAFGNGYVYFVKETGGGRIKIGKAIDPLERVTNGFGVKMPYALELVDLIKSENDLQTEKHFHDIFDKKRIHGEWFALEEADVEWIRARDFPTAVYESILADGKERKDMLSLE